MSYFSPADLLLPQNCDLQKWAVIACDQYTSQPEYWRNVEKFVADAPSTLHMFFSEAQLNEITDDKLAEYQKNMLAYLQDSTMHCYPNSYIYVERTLKNGKIRQGVVGVLDLEFYDYKPKPDTKIFATEQTVLQRVPPRVALRKDSSMEFSHTVVFCNDASCTLIESVGKVRNSLKKLYDFDLMCDGGNIRGYLLDGIQAEAFSQAISAYEAQNAYLVGDGNHSLVTAKLSYEALKATNPSADWSKHPARYAMVELENIYSDAMVFEPIYRILVCNDPEQFIADFVKLDDPSGAPVNWVNGEKEGIVHIPVAENTLLIEHLQKILDEWTGKNGGEVDYIHGAQTVRELAQRPDTVGFILPDFNKCILYPYVLSGKVMPRKTFSIGHATEKRYYLEGRKIK